MAYSIFFIIIITISGEKDGLLKCVIAAVLKIRFLTVFHYPVNRKVEAADTENHF